jgi:hypothetical protein
MEGELVRSHGELFPTNILIGLALTVATASKSAEYAYWDTTTD